MREYIEQRIEELKQQIPTFESYSLEQVCRIARRQELESLLEKFPAEENKQQPTYDILDTAEFADVMQPYRMAREDDQMTVCRRYELVKRFIRTHFTLNCE